MVEQLLDNIESAETNYDSSLDVSIRPEIDLSSLVQEFTREISRLRLEVLQVRQELDQVKNQQIIENQHKTNLLSEGPTG
jgi:hypothetical protein